MINWKDFVKRIFLKGTEYTGNTEPDKKIFSASMLGNPPLINYLKIKYGSHPSTEFGANTFGSVFHAGAEEIFLAEAKLEKVVGKENIETELSLSTQLDNGWTISGSIDLILKEYNMIIDWKVTTATTIKNVKKEKRMNGYALQLGVYKYLLKKETGKDFETALGIIDKNFSYFKQNTNLQLELMDVPSYDPDDIEAMLYDKTNQLDEYIKLNQEPPMCNNVFIYKPRGQRAKNMRCRHFCDNNINCSHYNNERDSIASILDL